MCKPEITRKPELLSSMNRTLFLSITALVFLVFAYACTKDQGKPLDVAPPPPGACDTITYNNQVKAIIDLKCGSLANGGAGCHSGAFPQAGVSLTTYQEVLGKADRIDERGVKQKTMPPAGQPQLSQTDLEHISCWLGNGKKE